MVDAVAWLEARHDVVKRAIGKVEPFFERHAVERSKRKAPNTGGRVFGAVGTWVRSVLQWTAVHTRAQYVKRSGCGACAGVAPTRGIPQVVSRRRGLDIPSDGREDFIGRDLRWARAPARLDLEPAADAARDIVFAVGPMVRCSSAAWAARRPSSAVRAARARSARGLGRHGPESEGAARPLQAYAERGGLGDSLPRSVATRGAAWAARAPLAHAANRSSEV